MDDERIVELYWNRSESAIQQTRDKYGTSCRCIACRILRDNDAAEEVLDDTCLGVWNAIPPQRPTRLRAFIGAIARHISLNRYDSEHAAKRYGETEAVLDEFWECVPDSGLPADEALGLREAVNGFLRSLDARTRVIFLRRYWYMCTVREIARGTGLSETNIKVILHRTRQKFRTYLHKEGFMS